MRHLNKLIVIGAGLALASVGPLLRRFNRVRALLRDAKEDLAALNSPSVMHGPGLDQVPEVVTMYQRKGLEPVAATSIDQLHRNNHKHFCAKWARAAKARFEFARVCEDTAINRAALHRWLLSHWKELRNGAGKGMPLHVMDLYMTDTLDMCFLQTAELMQSESKRAVRKRARMEYYNERKFVEGWK